jgi:hypothetical protein
VTKLKCPKMTPQIRSVTLSTDYSAVLSSYLVFKSINTETQKTIIFPTVSYGCETWSLVLWLMASKNRMLGKKLELIGRK